MTALRYFEDIVPGEVAKAGPVEITREAIVAFAQMYDPQPFHLDEVAASASLLDGLAASGWHTAALGRRLYHDGFVRHVASMGAPGIDELRWPRPVRPGDALRLTVTTGEARVSGSKPDRGYVQVALDLRNRAGETVMTERCTLIVRCRGASAAAATRQARVASPAIPPMPAADLMLTASFDEIEVGYEARFGTQLFTPELIVGFARLYDPQAFHTDPEAAAASHFGGLVASGWQTAAFWMKHYIAARRRSSEARQGAGLPAAVGGPSPGFTDLRWLRPVYAGDSVSYGMRITGKRKTRRPGWGLVSTINTGHASDGALVFSFEGRLLWPTGM